MPVQLMCESWHSIWPEARALALEHSKEVDDAGATGKPFDVDDELMRRMYEFGGLRVYSARRDSGELVGYLTWQCGADPESRGTLAAHQGAWFVLPGCPGAAWKLFVFSLRDLQAHGFAYAYPHHRLTGRGAHLGRWFEHLGAKPLHIVYALKLKG